MYKVLIFGDSLVQKLPVEKCSEKLKFHVECMPGLKAVEVVDGERLRDGYNNILTRALEEDDYDYCVICLGTNDVNASIKDVVHNLNELCRIVTKRGVVPVRVFLHGCHDKFNTLYSESCDSKVSVGNGDFEEEDAVFCEYFLGLTRGKAGSKTDYLEKDGIHLTRLGRKKFVEDIVATIMEVL